MFRRIGEYISLDLFNFVSLTSSSLIPRIQLSQACFNHCQEFPPCCNFYHPGRPTFLIVHIPSLPFNVRLWLFLTWARRPACRHKRLVQLIVPCAWGTYLSVASIRHEWLAWICALKGLSRAFGTSAVAGVARTVLKSTTNCLRNSRSGFLLGIYSRNLSRGRVWLQGRGSLGSRFCFP